MSKLVRFLVLAASRRHSSVCFAGKAIGRDEPGSWIRPVSYRDGRVSASDFFYEGSGQPMGKRDLVELHLAQPVPCYGYQCENWLVERGLAPQKLGRVPKARMIEWCDTPSALWHNGYSSRGGLNDRIPLELACHQSSGSLLFVELHAVHFIVSRVDDGRQRVRARFRYGSDEYRLVVTDRECESWALAQGLGEHRLTGRRVFGCISLGEPYHDHAYKLLAGVYSVRIDDRDADL